MPRGDAAIGNDKDLGKDQKMTLAAANSDNSIRVVMIRSSSIGDVVLATACLNFLAQYEKDFCVYWIGRSPSLDLIASAYEQLVPLKMPHTDAELASLLELLGPVHLVCDLQTNMRSYRLAKRIAQRNDAVVSRAQKNSLYRAGLVLKARLRGRKWRQKIEMPARQQYDMMQSALISGLRRLGMKETEGAHPWLPLKKLANKHHQCLGVAPGASYDTKKAPTQVFVDIIKKVRQETEGELVVQFFGDKNDEQSVADIMKFFGDTLAYESFAGKLTLAETAEKLSGCQVLLSNDSSLCHIAEAVGTEAAVLFGPTSELFGFTPWRKESRTFSVPLGCRPCSKHGKIPCRYEDKLCFNELNTNAIGQFLVDRLKS